MTAVSLHAMRRYQNSLPARGPWAIPSPPILFCKSGSWSFLVAKIGRKQNSRGGFQWRDRNYRAAARSNTASEEGEGYEAAPD